MGGGVFLFPIDELFDALGGLETGLPEEAGGGEGGDPDDFDVDSLGEIKHGDEVIVDGFVGDGTGVAGDVVDAGEEHDDFGADVDDIGAEAHEHLEGGFQRIQPRLDVIGFCRGNWC